MDDTTAPPGVAVDAAAPQGGSANASGNAVKKPGGRWTKGQSGNPRGKRPGTRHRATVLAEQIMSDDIEAVIGKVVKAAKRGDMQAARLILDRILPVRKGRAAPFPLPPMTTTADIVSAMASVTAALAAGQLSPAEAVEVGAVLELHRKAIETNEHAARLAAIEERMALHVEP